MVNLQEAKIGDHFIIMEINAPYNSLIFLKALGLDINTEVVIRGEGYFPKTMLIEVDGRIIQLDGLTIHQVNGEIVKVKKLVK